MKDKLTLLLFLLPVILMAQPNPGKPDQEQQKPDFKRDGLFQALFHAGVNAAQIDGDACWGYNKIGLDIGVGVLVRFHKYLSVSMGVDYSMKGARQSFIPNKDSSQHDLYRVGWDYVEIPLLLNIHDKNIVMFSIGPQIGFMTRYREWNPSGIEVTNNVTTAPPYYGQPHRVDLEAVAALHFLIKRHFAIGAKFSYSIIKLRSSVPGNGFHGEYNNLLTVDFMYILSTVKKK